MLKSQLPNFTDSVPNSAALRIQKFIRLRRLDSLQNKILDTILAVAEHRYLMHRYKSTLELSDAYNKAGIFTEIDKERLLYVARVVLERYSYIKKPNRQQIFEIADLSGFDNREISRGIFNSLIEAIYSLNPDIPNLDKIAAIPRMLRLLPPRFLSEEHPDVAIKVLSKISGWLSEEYKNLKDPEAQSDRLLPILKIYADILDSLLDNRQLFRMSLYNDMQGVPISAMIESYRKDIIATELKAKSLSRLDSLNLEDILNIDESTTDRLRVCMHQMISHPVMEVKYLSQYIIKSLDRITDASSLHLLLGAKSFGLSSAKSCDSIESYKTLFNYVMMRIDSLEENPKDCYNIARQLMAVIPESEGDAAKLRFAIAKVSSYYKVEKSISCELSYVMLSSLIANASKYSDVKIALEVLALAARIALDARYEMEVQIAAIEILIESASSSVENVSSVAKKYIESNIYPASLRSGKKLSDSLMIRMGAIAAVEIKKAPPQKSNSIQDDLLTTARLIVFPLEKKSSDLREQVLRYRLKTFIEESLTTYIPLLGAVSKYSSNKDQFFLLEKKVKTFIEDRKAYDSPPVLIIHGNVGSGKSLFGRYLEKKYWNQYEQGGTIPLFISLPSLQISAHKAIEKALLSYGFTHGDVLQLKLESHKYTSSFKKIWRFQKDLDGKNKKNKNGKLIGTEFVKEYNLPRLLVILDVYDEASIDMNYAAPYESDGWHNIKIIVLSRNEYLSKSLKSDLFSSIAGNICDEIFIRPFDDGQIKSFISQRLKRWQEIGDEKGQSGLSQADFERLMLGNKDLSVLIERPFMLEIVMEVLPKLKENKDREHSLAYNLSSLRADQQDLESSIETIIESYVGLGKVTRYEIYDLFLISWFKRESIRQRKLVAFLPKDFNPEYSAESYAIAVAAFMFKHNTQIISQESVNYRRADLIGLEDVEFFGNDVKTMSRKIAPFKRMDEVNYTFIHKSIQEFLVAKGMLLEIRDFAMDPGKEISKNSLINIDYIQKDPSVLSFVLDCITYRELHALEKIILSTRAYAEQGKISPLVIAAANAATIYVRTHYTQIIGYRDWSYTQINGADISGARFYGMNFSSCSWRNVTARSFQMHNSKYNNINLTGFYTGEYAALNVCEEGVTSISCKGQYAFTGSNDKKIRIWDVESSTCLRVMDGHNDLVSSVYVRDDHLFSGSSDKTVRVWCTETGRCLLIMQGHKKRVNSVFALGKYVISGSDDNTIKVWDMDSGKCLNTIYGHRDSVTSVFAFCDNLFSGSIDKTVRVWSVDTGESILLFAGHIKPVNSVYAIGHYVFSGSADKTVRIWDKNSESCFRVLVGHEKSVSSVCASDIHVFSGSADKTVRIWDILSGECLKVMKGHTGLVNSVCAAKPYLFSGASDGSIKAWDIDTEVILGHSLLGGHKERVVSICARDNYVFSSSYDKGIRIWDAASGECLKLLKGHSDIVNSVYASGRYIFSGSLDKTVKIWRKDTDGCVRVLMGHTNSVTSVFAAGDKVISGSLDKTVRIWDMSSGACLHVLQGHEEWVSSVFAFGQYVFSGSGDQTVMVWGIDSGKCIKVLEGHEGSVDSLYARGSYVLSGSWDQTVRVWGMLSGECLRVLHGHLDIVNSVYGSEHYVFSASSDKTVRIWDIKSGDCLCVLDEHIAIVIGVHLIGSQLVSADVDGVIISRDISDINNVKMKRAFGRSSWEQPFILSGNEAGSIWGLSHQNQRLFEQHEVMASYKENADVHSANSDTSSEKEVIAELREQNNSLQSIVDKLEKKLEIQQVQQDRMFSMLKSVFSKVEGEAEELGTMQVFNEANPTSSSNLSGSVVMPMPPSSSTSEDDKNSTLKYSLKD